MGIRNLNKNKLLKLRDWLTVQEAARHLSNLFEDEVSEADVLRLALDGHLKLSVNFVNHAYAKQGKLISLEEDDEFVSLLKEIPDENREKFIKGMEKFNMFGSRIPKLSDKVTSIDGVWDLSMVGNERLDIEHEYQMMTGGPEITLQGLDGAFVERGDDQVCQLQTDYDDNEYHSGSSAQLKKIKEHIANKNIQEDQARELLSQYKKNREEYLKKRKKINHSDNYFPAGGLPHDSVLVVRTQALIDLQERLSEDDSKKNRSVDIRSETTYLNIIGAMLETFIHRSHGDLKFSSEAKLREFLSQKYVGFKGLTERTLADKFSAAKKAIREEID